MAESSRQDRRDRRKIVHQRREILVIGIIAVIAMAGILIYTMNLRKTRAEYESRADALVEQIAQESLRSEELDRQEEYMKTLEYVEQIARERLGLVRPGDTVVKPEE